MQMRTPADIGAMIREGRRKLGLDQAALAKKAGVSRLWINQVERGKPGASMALVLRTLAALGVELHADIDEARNRELPNSVVTPDINAIVNAARTGKLP